MKFRSLSTPSWYTRFFGNDYLRVFAPYLEPRRTEAELRGMLGLLRLPAGARILDLACGQGRHSIPLAALGYRVTGLDLSPEVLARAASSARDSGVPVCWIRADMQRLPLAAAFDAVVNVFTSFGYLESQEADQSVVEAVARALVPGGVFLLETVSRDALVRHFTPSQVERRERGLLVLQEQEFNQRSGRLAVRLTLVEADGVRREYTQSIRFYTLTELAAMLQKAGLRLQSYYGDYDGSKLTVDSRRLILVCLRSP
jgi:SAM-dependent methyltransferase